MAGTAKTIRDGITSVLVTLVVLLLIFAGLFVLPPGGYLPSLFFSGLSDSGYLYWNRWINLSAHEAAIVAVTAAIAVNLIYLTFDPVYRFFRHRKRVTLLIGLAVVASLVIGRDLLAGYALYPDRIVVRPALSLSVPQTYSLNDIDHVEVGCHERFNIRRRSSNQWPVPAYTFVFRDGQRLSPFDLADRNYADPALLSAVLRLDADLNTRGVRKVYRRTFLDTPMDGDQCFARMDTKFASDLHPAMRRAFRLP